MRFYTAKGDDGTTDLLGARVGKDDPRIVALGDLDEATSAIGVARSLTGETELQETLVTVQRDLYAIMAELAFTDEIRPDAFHFPAERTAWLETATDQLAAVTPLAPQFVLPGDSTSGAAFDLARAIVRRAERSSVALGHDGALPNQEILRYLNRLSSFLFIAARHADQADGTMSTRAKT